MSSGQNVTAIVGRVELHAARSPPWSWKCFLCNRVSENGYETEDAIWQVYQFHLREIHHL